MRQLLLERNSLKKGNCILKKCTECNSTTLVYKTEYGTLCYDCIIKKTPLDFCDECDDLTELIQFGDMLLCESCFKELEDKYEYD